MHGRVYKSTAVPNIWVDILSANLFLPMLELVGTHDQVVHFYIADEWK